MSIDDLDVLVIGFGAAGAGAAIAGHDAGARVGVIEKTGAGGGNCRHSGGFLFDVDDEVAIEHLDALCFGKTDRSVLTAYAAGLHEVRPFLESLGGEVETARLDEFGGLLPSWPHFPGAGRVHYHRYHSGTNGPPGHALWQLLDDNVRERGIEVGLDCRATALTIRHGAVTGAEIDRDGTPCTIQARGGVVLASGGFEYDAELCDAYLPLPLVPVGHPGNTGDTLRLAAQAGATLWHMSSFFGWFAFRHPDHPAGFPLDVHAPSFIYVDADGRRFADETGWEVHDKVRSMTAYLPRRANHPHLPGHLIFDEAARLAGPLNGIVGTPNDYRWSPENRAEVERGWIKRGETAHDLATQTGIDPATLSATLDRYTAATITGRDDEFDRAPETLARLEPPLYAIEMWPAVATASGGPRRDGLARVLRPGGAPIDGLYAAGAAGSIWGHLTEHGGGLTDAIVFGRIAGEEAAARAVSENQRLTGHDTPRGLPA
ncbi:MAG TPA: FAD-binding protein [Solirubrobacteraceae bacterium]|jgi:succinate dehydrogenase/fumarate reductase flavoprotein subunit